MNEKVYIWFIFLTLIGFYADLHPAVVLVRVPVHGVRHAAGVEGVLHHVGQDEGVHPQGPVQAPGRSI